MPPTTLVETIVDVPTLVDDFCLFSLTSVERILTNLLTSLNTHPQGVVVFDRLIVPKEVCQCQSRHFACRG